MTIKPDPPTPRDRKADAMRRLQVGGTGLILVTLLVGLSTLLTSENRDPANGSEADASLSTGDAAPGNGDDPLTDLGVEPASTEQPAAVPEVPAPEAPAPVGPLVPDLQPDPQLDGIPPQQ